MEARCAPVRFVTLTAAVLVLSLVPGLLAAAPCFGSQESVGQRVRAPSLVLLELELGLARQQSAPIRASVRLSPGGNGGPVVAREAEVPGQLSFQLARDSSWFLAVEAPGWWAPPITLEIGRTDLQRSVLLEPGGELVAALVVADGRSLAPEHPVSVRFLPVSSKEVLAARMSLCRRGDATSDDWRCPLPVGRWDLRLRAQGYVSLYTWDVAVGEGSRSSIDKTVLRAGASLTGWIEVHGDPQPGSVATVKLRPTTLRQVNQTEQGSELERRAGMREWSTTAGHGGFFHFEAIAPGVYEVVAEQAGLAPARSPLVEISGTTESVLREPLVLGELSSVALQLDPALDPRGHPWRVQLIPYSVSPASFEPAVQGTVDPTGFWEGSDVAAGEYWVSVRSDDNAEWHRRTEVIEARTTFLEIGLPLVRVIGSVRAGSEPLESTLRFWGDGERVDAETDENGEFAVTLPRAGSWQVEVRSRDGLVKRRLAAEIAEPRGERTAKLTLELPNGRLRGRVVDVFGRPAPQTTVLATFVPKERLRTLLVRDEEGRFEMAGLDRGTVRLHAWNESQGWRSRQRAVLVDGVSVPEVTLVVEPTLQLHGRVVDSGSAVPNARLIVDPGDAPLTWLDPVLTGLGGEFVVDVPARTRSVNVAVQAPGFVLRVLRLEASEDGSVGDVALERAGGDLMVHFDDPPGPEFLDGRAHVLFHQDGGYVLLDHLRSWAHLNGARAQDSDNILVPRVQDGFHRFCRLKQDNLWRALVSSAPGEVDCVSGYLSPGGVLELRVPSSTRR